VLDGSAGVLALDVVEYFELADLPVVEPVFCAMKGEGNVPPNYLVLVGANSGISSLEGLRGRPSSFTPTRAPTWDRFGSIPCSMTATSAVRNISLAL